MWKSVHRRDAELAEVRGAEIRTLPFQLTFLTLVVSLGYLDVVTQNFRPLALTRTHLGPDEFIDKLKALQNRPLGEVYPLAYLDAWAIYTKALTLPGDPSNALSHNRFLGALRCSRHGGAINH
jgi:hypothetical protein